MSRREQFVLIVEWEEWRGGGDPPRFIGPFPSSKEADQFARMNVIGATWDIAPLSRPYLETSGS